MAVDDESRAEHVIYQDKIEDKDKFFFYLFFNTVLFCLFLICTPHRHRNNVGTVHCLQAGKVGYCSVVG